MSQRPDRKLYLGPRLRMLRRELGLTQTQMATELGVSPSYLNHLERNQRPVTAQMLLRMAETYDIDVRGFVAGAREATTSDLQEVFADELVREIGVDRSEILEVTENYPNVAEAVKRLYRALTDLRQLPARVSSGEGVETRLASPLAWARDWLESRRNHFAELDQDAETLSQALGEGAETIREAMLKRLQDHGVSVRVASDEVLPDLLRHYDYHRRRLMLSERLSPAGRLFGIAVELARHELADRIGEVVEAAAPATDETRALARQIATNYAAAALLMPYGRFRAAAEAGTYDLDRLIDRFGCSYEQVAHRLTTLDRPGARGVPFFLLKLDVAGNVMKRYAGEASPLARFSGGCPRWKVHRAFRRAGETVVDLAQMPDGGQYLTWARAIWAVVGSEPVLIVLGCEAEHASRIGYAPPSLTPTPIGPACHLCERTDCDDRSLPPIMRALEMSALRRTRPPYPFRSI